MAYLPPQKKLAEALRYLRSRGFIPTGRRAGSRLFEGKFPCKGESIKVRLTISDWDFINYPEITILEKPDKFPSLAPHITSDGWLCYFAKGSVILDRYDPAESIAQCLDQAQKVLEEIRFNPDYRSQDIQNEFLINWFRGQSTDIWRVLIGNIENGSQKSNYWIISSKSNSYYAIADDPKEVSSLASALGGESPDSTKCPCWIFKTHVMPSVPESMPVNVQELFAWLRDWDLSLSKGIQKVLDTEKTYLHYKFATFAVSTPVGWLGFGFDIDLIHRRGYKNKPRLFRQYLHSHGQSIGILRLLITEFGSDYVHSRNLTSPNLKDKRIKLVGCGAIGSQIASGLVRLGAGSGKGVIEIIDDGYMETENLGRHYLGYPSIFKSKVQALAEELTRQFPMVNIEATFRKVDNFKKLFNADIVVDATGEEAVSEMLNGWRLQLDSATPLLHVRIRGNGESVQTFWGQGTKEGCFRCLLNPSGKSYREERHKLLKKEIEYKRLGCSAFTPYAISSPMAAAALCLESIVDWLKTADPSPRFRTRSTSNGEVYKVADQNIERLKDCPACGDKC